MVYYIVDRVLGKNPPGKHSFTIQELSLFRFWQNFLTPGAIILYSIVDRVKRFCRT